MDWKKLLLAAIAFAVIGNVVHIAGSFVDTKYYVNPAFYPLWSHLMMPGAGPPGLDFFAVSVIFALAMGAIYAFAYTKTKQLFAGKRSFRADRKWEIGLKFGVALFGLTGFTSGLTMYLLLAVPLGLQASWMAQSLVTSVASGVAFSKILG